MSTTDLGAGEASDVECKGLDLRGEISYHLELSSANFAASSLSFAALADVTASRSPSHLPESGKSLSAIEQGRTL